ncbi:OLC1v1031577C1 [Oldenlandia corymbosa var. corymbosa]|nr:OLC1v1031577C1 [Oldenlandia corymbosa var. corymbosa]
MQALNMATPLFTTVTPNATKLPTNLPLAPKPATLSAAAGFRSSSSLKTSAAAATAVYETVDYNSTYSVFPAEACETLGGDACLADIFPEVKLQPQGKSTIRNSELVERDYLQYNDPKT